MRDLGRGQGRTVVDELGDAQPVALGHRVAALPGRGCLLPGVAHDAMRTIAHVMTVAKMVIMSARL